MATSKLEAKYFTCSVGCREVTWLLHLHRDIHSKDTALLSINCNNQGALSNIIAGIRKACTKHMVVCYHNSQDLHACGIGDYSYMHTHENVADIVMKVLTKDTQEKFTKEMGYCNGDVDVRLDLRWFHLSFRLGTPISLFLIEWPSSYLGSTLSLLTLAEFPGGC